MEAMDSKENVKKLVPIDAFESDWDESLDSENHPENRVLELHPEHLNELISLVHVDVHSLITKTMEGVDTDSTLYFDTRVADLNLIAIKAAHPSLEYRKAEEYLDDLEIVATQSKRDKFDKVFNAISTGYALAHFELQMAKRCVDCVTIYHLTKKSEVPVCRRPHLLVLYFKSATYPLWPAKAIEFVTKHKVKIHCFGDNQRLFVPLSKLYLMTENFPFKLQRRLGIIPSPPNQEEWEAVQPDLFAHVKNLRDSFQDIKIYAGKATPLVVGQSLFIPKYKSGAELDSPMDVDDFAEEELDKKPRRESLDAKILKAKLKEECLRRQVRVSLTEHPAAKVRALKSKKKLRTSKATKAVEANLESQLPQVNHLEVPPVVVKVEPDCDNQEVQTPRDHVDNCVQSEVEQHSRRQVAAEKAKNDWLQSEQLLIAQSKASEQKKTLNEWVADRNRSRTSDAFAMAMDNEVAVEDPCCAECAIEALPEDEQLTTTSQAVLRRSPRKRVHS